MVNLCFSDGEIEAIRAHYGELDPAVEASLRSDRPEDPDYIDGRRRQRRLLDIWAGRKAVEGDVHTSHCCEKHGCKYGDEACPVAMKVSPQEYLCEECEQDIYTLKWAEPLALAYARSVAFLDIRAGNYLIVDGEKLRLAKPEPKEDIPEPVLMEAQHSDLVRALQTAYLAGAV